MNSRKVKEIVKFYIQKNVQNKWFVLVNIVILITMLVSTNASHIKNFLESKDIELFKEEFKIEIIDKENLAKEEILKQFENRENIEIEEVEENNYTKDNIPKNFALIEIKADEESIVSATITSKEGIDNEIYAKISEGIKIARNNIFAKNLGIEAQELNLLSEAPKVERVFLGADAENSSQKEAIKLVSTLVVYMVSIFIFSKIANEIAQEKVSKSIEYVLTSVTAEEYLLAKIVGVMAVVLIQIIYGLAYFIIGNLISNIITFFVIGGNFIGLVENSIATLDKDIVEYIILVFVYAFLNLILMSIIQAALSSKTTSMSEAGNSVMFLMIVTIVAYFITLGLITPYTNMTIGLYILSCLPLLSNYFIPAIVIIGQGTALQIIVSFLLIILAIPITFKVCAKVLKNGVLDYSNKKTKKKEKTFEEEQKILMNKTKYRQFSFAIGMSILIFVITQVLMQLVMEVIVAPFLKVDASIFQLISMSVTSLVSFLAAYGFVRIYTEGKKEKVKTDKKIKAKYCVIGLSLIVILQAILSYLFSKIGLDYNVVELVETEGKFSLLTAILYIVTIALVPAIFEELFFRKALIDFSKKYGKVFAIIISAIIFGLAHMNLSQFIFAFLLGIIFGTIYVYSNDIKLTILLHFLNNGYVALFTVLLTNGIIGENFVEKFNLIVFIISVIVLIVATINFIKNNKEGLKKIKFKKENISEYKYIFLDFTLLISLTLVICCFALTEKLLRLM